MKQDSPRDLWRKAEAAAERGALEDKLALQIRACHLPTPQREFEFHPDRHWRFDFAWPEFLVAAEVDGGIWSKGRHVRGAGFERDAEKLNAAAGLGWRVFRYTERLIRSGVAVLDLKRQLERASWGRHEE